MKKEFIKNKNIKCAYCGNGVNCKDKNQKVLNDFDTIYCKHDDQLFVLAYKKIE